MLNWLHTGSESRVYFQVLKDDTTLEDNKISNENFVVVMVTKVSTPMVSQLTLSYSQQTGSGFLYGTLVPSAIMFFRSPRRPQLALPRRTSSLQQLLPVQHPAQR